MGLPTTRPNPRVITASAARLRSGTRDTQSGRRMETSWQLQNFMYYDQIGEVRYACQFYAKQMSRVRFYPARRTPTNEIEPIDSGPPVDLLNKIQDPAGGRSRLQYDYGRLMMVTGEGVLFGYPIEDPTRWRFVWTGEVKKNEEGNWERVSTAQKPLDPPEVGVGYRLWTPHPKHSLEPDCPLRAVQIVCAELIALTDSVMGTAVTRMTNGILALATELSPSPEEPGADEDPEQNIFIQDYIEHVQNQKDNPASAAAKVPFLLEGGYEYIADGIKWIQTHDPQTDYMEKDLRAEAIKRLGLGFDFPPEYLLGMTDANHWTAKQVQHDMWRNHGAILAEQFADDVAEAYLRPALEEDGYTGWEDVVIAYDDSQVVISPDRSADADAALDRVAISFEGYRELKGIPESMAPDEDEKAFLAALKTRGQVQLEDGQLVQPERGPLPSRNGNDAQDGPPAPTGGRTGSRQESARAASIRGAALLAIRECRAKAGSRLRSASHSCDECKRKTDGIHNSLVAATLGPKQVDELRGDPMKLVQGGTREFQALLQEWGIEPVQAEALGKMVELYSAKTLFQQEMPGLPSAFLAQLEKAREVSDALVSTGP